MTTTPVRIRFAPSPTGELHIGGVRTALWTWLHARHSGGTFILRIEDTDRSREVAGAVPRIMEALRWLGIEWDEGPDIGGPHAPYYQSQRLALYQEAARRLVAQGDAYPCFCSAEELDALRKRQQQEKRPTGYEGKCRAIPPDEAAKRVEAREPHVVRFAVPREGATTGIDMLRGEITVQNSTIDDFVMLKSDGFPTYHLAHVVDDHEMEISHIIRAEEWLPSLPRHILIWDALGYPKPALIHVPVILAPGGGKLSKRHGAKSVQEYAEDGYLPDALVNFLCITGWGHGDETVFRRQRLIEIFDIGDISLAPAAFDIEKLTWLNGVYLREMPEAEFVEHVAARLERDLPAEVPRPLDRATVEAITPLIRERVHLLSEVAPMVDFFYLAEIDVPPAREFLQKKWANRATDAANALAAVTGALEALDGWDAEPMEARMRALADELGEKAGDLFTLVRLAVTGKRVTPPLFESMEILGPDACLDRLRASEAALRTA
jgi:glutamyl-tRNA synthetase